MEWIKVEDRLPNQEEQVIAYVKGHPSPIQMLAYEGGVLKTWYCWVEDNDITEFYQVTHWVELPEPPNP
jgi:hypothetical protein